MKRLYQWFGERASFFFSDSDGDRTSRTVRTEVTVQREAMTLLVSEAAAPFAICPFCGQKSPPAQAKQTRLRLQESSISQEDVPADGTCL
jgi:hypothetical protein